MGGRVRGNELRSQLALLAGSMGWFPSLDRMTRVLGGALVTLGLAAGVGAAVLPPGDSDGLIDRALDHESKLECAESSAAALTALQFVAARHGQNSREMAEALSVYGLALVCSPGHASAALRICQRAESLGGGGSESDQPFFHERLRNCLASAHEERLEYEQALPLRREQLALSEQAKGADSTFAGYARYRLANVLLLLGRSESIELYKKNVDVYAQGDGRDSLGYAIARYALASGYLYFGDAQSSLPLWEESLLSAEKWDTAANKRYTADALLSLALTYGSLGRDTEAEAVALRAVALHTETYGESDLRTISAIQSLGYIYAYAGQYDDAVENSRRAIALLETGGMTFTEDYGVALTTLAGALALKGEYAEAEKLYRRVHDLAELILPSDHFFRAGIHYNLVYPLERMGRLDEADAFLSEAEDILNRSDVPATHLVRGYVFVRRSRVDLALGRSQTAWQAASRAAALCRTYVEAAQASPIDTLGGSRFERETCFLEPVHVAHALQDQAGFDRAQLLNESFEAAQLMRASPVAAAVRNLAAIAAARTDELAELARRRQALRDRNGAINRLMLQSLGSSERIAALEASWRDETAQNTAEIGKIDAALRERYPDYFDLVSAAPVDVAATQALLRPGEALLLYAFAREESYVFAVTKDKIVLRAVETTADGLRKDVAALRTSLSLEGVTSGAGVKPFDLVLSHKLHETLLGPLAEDLKGIDKLIVVPDDALESLPPSVLVVTQKEGAVSDEDAYRGATWLSDRFALSVLPSVDSLRALRREAQKIKASAPFLGFGNPQLAAERVPETLTIALKGRGFNADGLRSLRPLPETEGELREIARSLGADPVRSLMVRDRATEGEVKAVSDDGRLKNTRVVAFATHALAADGALRLGFSEPGIVLTPPAAGSDVDDGYLSASEVTLLEMNSEWVILSACNTAGADGTPGARPLSGLARAFFHAGARSLLVSHWPVESTSSALTTTEMMRLRARDKNMGRAAALGLAQRKIRDKTVYSHPAFWAPYVVVGDGS